MKKGNAVCFLFSGTTIIVGMTHVRSHNKGEDVHDDTCFVLRAVQSCCKKRVPKYENNVLSEPFGNPRALFPPHWDHFCALVFESWTEIWQGCA